MTKEMLSYLNNCISKEFGLPYEFGEWTQGFQLPYYVGEYTETESLTEDGMEEGTFILTGITDKGKIDLENTKEKIKEKFQDFTTLLDSGSGAAISYINAMYIDTNAEGIDRMEINLKVREWRI